MKNQEDLRKDAAVLHQLYSYKFTCIMIAAERLGLFDDLQTATTVQTIAEKRKYAPDQLLRLLYGIEAAGLAYRDGEAWQLTMLGRRIVESPSNIREQIRQTAVALPLWLDLGIPEQSERRDSLKQGTGWTTQDFQKVMQVNVPGVLRVLNDSDRIPVTGTIVDVGGGLGGVLAGLLAARPKLKGVLVELPQVAELASKSMKASYPESVDTRIDVVGGDMFAEECDWRGDVNLLVNILHDWPRAAARELMKKCHANAPRLIIVERVVIPGREYMLALHDLHMMAVTGGKQRSVAEFEELARESGFRVVDSELSDLTFSVLELERE